METVEKDRTAHLGSSTSPEKSAAKMREEAGSSSSSSSSSSADADASSTSAATKMSRKMESRVRQGLELLKKWGVSIALSLDQICIAVEQVKVSLEGVVTRSDDWWAQSSHFRMKDFNFTLSGSAQGGFLSYDVLEVRLLEDDDDLYQPNEFYDSEEEEDEWEMQQQYLLQQRLQHGGSEGVYLGEMDMGGEGWRGMPEGHESDDIAARLTDELVQDTTNDLFQYTGRGGAGGAEAGRRRDGIDLVQDQINRRLFSNGDTTSDIGSAQRSKTHVAAAGAADDAAMRAARQFRRQKDHFSLALEKAPLLSLSSFSCGASVFLELAQMDFTSRHAMMDSYSEIKKMYKTGTAKNAMHRNSVNSASGSRDGSGVAGGDDTSNLNSPNRARREHLRLRQEMFPRGRGRASRTALGEQANKSYNRAMLALGTVGFFLLGLTRQNK